MIIKIIFVYYLNEILKIIQFFFFNINNFINFIKNL